MFIFDEEVQSVIGQHEGEVIIEGFNYKVEKFSQVVAQESSIQLTAKRAYFYQTATAQKFKRNTCDSATTVEK